jgi:hypothetical protein
MTFLAITFYWKSLSGVMTAPAWPAWLHIPHKVSFALWPGDKELTMALAALITGIYMKLVTEKCIGIKCDVFYSMTLGAASGDVESGFTVMTAATGKTALHLFHGHMGIGTVGLEEFGVTNRATEEWKVKLVTEGHGPEIGNFYRDLFCQMTGAALSESESPHLVMAQTAWLPFLHLSHRDNGVFFADFKKSVMTEGTVVSQFL